MCVCVWPHLCLNDDTPEPRRGSSGRTAAYTPIPCLMSAPSRLKTHPTVTHRGHFSCSWYRNSPQSLQSTPGRSDIFLHSPIGGKFFLYVIHSRDVTSAKISSFSARKPDVAAKSLRPQRFPSCQTPAGRRGPTCERVVLFPQDPNGL